MLLLLLSLLHSRGHDRFAALDHVVHLARELALWIGQVKEGLDDLGLEHLVLLPKVEYADDLALLFFRAFVQVEESQLDVLGESRREDVLVGPELVSGLAHDGVDDVQPGDLVLRTALLYELLHALNYMLVELDSLDGTLGDGGHLGFGDGWLRLVQGREL